MVFNTPYGQLHFTVVQGAIHYKGVIFSILPAGINTQLPKFIQQLMVYGFTQNSIGPLFLARDYKALHIQFEHLQY